MSDSPEYKTFSELSPDIQTAIRMSVGPVASAAFAKGLITSTQQNTITHMFLPPDTQAGELVKAVLDRIYNDPAALTTFRNILDSYPAYKAIVERIDETQSLHRRRAKLKEPVGGEKGSTTGTYTRFKQEGGADQTDYGNGATPQRSSKDERQSLYRRRADLKEPEEKPVGDTGSTAGLKRRHIKNDRGNPDPQIQSHLQSSRCGTTRSGVLVLAVIIIAFLAIYAMVQTDVKTDKEPLSTTSHHHDSSKKNTDHVIATGNTRTPEHTQQAARWNEARHGCKPIDNVKEVFDAISEDISDWRRFGVELGLTSTILDRIGIEQHNELHRLMGTIEKWYDKDPDNSCWEVVIRALVNMEMSRVAKRIADKQQLDWEQFKS